MTTTADRVRELILASGRSQHAFAVEIGLDDSKLSKSLSGTRRFSSLDLARIAELCTVTVDWLITGEEPELAVAARTTGGSAGAALTEARRLVTLRTDLAELGYPQSWRLPAAELGAGSWAEQGRRLADAALATAGGEVADLLDVVETAFGIDVAVTALGDGFDGLATSSDTVKLIVLATTTVPARQRFTLAHELAHLVAGDDQGVHLDRDVFDRAQMRNPSEVRANAFAAALLMPVARLRAAVGARGIDEAGFAQLACDLVVSPSTLAIRLKELRLIDGGTCERWRPMTARRAAAIAGRGAEFADQVAAANRPRAPGLLTRDAYAAYDAGDTTLRPYAALLGVDVDVLRRTLEPEASDAS